jgi:hypothetical protein
MITTSTYIRKSKRKKKKKREELWKNYGTSNISPCKNIIFKKKNPLKKKPKSFKILL